MDACRQSAHFQTSNLAPDLLGRHPDGSFAGLSEEPVTKSSTRARGGYSIPLVGQTFGRRQARTHLVRHWIFTNEEFPVQRAAPYAFGGRATGAARRLDERQGGGCPKAYCPTIQTGVPGVPTVR